MTAAPAIALRRTVAVLMAVLAVALVASRADAARDPAQPVLREAASLAQHWGRCPTSRPAHAALLRAQHAGPRVRPAKARAALRAWRTVVRECSVPVAMPAAVPTA